MLLTKSRPLTGNRTAGQFFKETAEEITAFYGDFYSNGGKSPVGRALGTFLGDVLATPSRALEAKEFLTDPEYRQYVNPGGTSLKDYLGAVLNLGLELGVIKLEVLLVKAVGRALRPALKNLGEKIAEALKRDGMEPLVADNYAKRFDEAVKDASDTKLNQAADDAVQGKSGSGTPGKGPHRRTDIDREIEGVLSRRRKRLGSSGAKVSAEIDLDDLSEIVDVGQLLLERGATKFKDWQSAISSRFGETAGRYHTAIYHRLRAGGGRARILDDLSDIGVPSNPQNVGRVIRVTGDEFGKNLDLPQTRPFVRAHVKAIAGKVVKIAEDGRAVKISSDAGYKVSNVLAKSQLAIAMEDIIRSARYLRTLSDSQGKPAIWHYYVSEIELGGNRRRLILAIQEDANGNLFFDWNFEYAV